MSSAMSTPIESEQSNSDAPIAGALRPARVLHRHGCVTSAFVCDEDKEIADRYGFTLDLAVQRSDAIMDAALAKAAQIKSEMKPTAQSAHLDKLYDETAAQIKKITSESLADLSKVEARLNKLLPEWPTKLGDTPHAESRQKEVRDELRRLAPADRLITIKDAANHGRVELIDAVIRDPLHKMLPASIDLETLKSKALRAAFPKCFEDLDRLMRLKSLMSANGQIYLRLIHRGDKGFQITTQ